MMKFNVLLIALLLSSCATRKKTIIYSALASSIAGTLVGKAVSPNEESNSVNMAGGMIVGAIVGGVYGDSVYRDRHPDIEMKEIPLERSPNRVNQIKLNLSNLGIPSYTPEILKSTDKEYVQVSSQHKGIARRQYVIEHLVEERSIIAPDGKKYIYPKMKIIEVGVENE